MENAVCTVVTRNHFHYAKTLMESIERSGTQAQRFVLVIDAAEDKDRFVSDLFETITLECLSIPRLKEQCFSHTAYEMCAFSKPFLMEYVIGIGFSKALFADGDTCVYHSLDYAIRLLEDHDGLFTPHITQPLDDDHFPNDQIMLNNGTINVGFFALKASSRTTAFLKWWQQKVLSDCYLEPERGVFCEQKWTDFIPSLFPTLALDRNPGTNVAYWNLPHRHVTKTGTSFCVNDGPLVLFHFSGFDPRNPTLLSNGDTRLVESGMPGPVQELASAYAERLEANGLEHYRSYAYRFNFFSDGRTAIAPLIRKVYRRDPVIQKVFEHDPFDVTRDPGFRHTYNRRAFGPRNPATAVLHAVYESEAEAQRLLPHPETLLSIGLAAWFLQRGVEKYGLDYTFLRPIETFLRKKWRLSIPGMSSLAHWVFGVGEIARQEQGAIATESREASQTSTRSFRRTLLQRIMSGAWGLMKHSVAEAPRVRIKMWLMAAVLARSPSPWGGTEAGKEGKESV